MKSSSEIYRPLDSVVAHETLFPQVAEDLQTLSHAHNYQRWIYSAIAPALGRRIVEVGAGIGNYTPLLLRHGPVLAVEPEPAYVQFLRKRFAGCVDFGVVDLALGDWPEETRARVRQFRPDTFVCLNVLEHVESDAAAIGAMYRCLEPHGHIVLVLPAMSCLYSELDRRYGHFRRYQKPDAARLVAGLRDAVIARCAYMNAPGAIGWWINHVVLRRQRLSHRQTRFFDKGIVPFAAAIERFVPMSFGLSLVVWIRRGA